VTEGQCALWVHGGTRAVGWSSAVALCAGPEVETYGQEAQRALVRRLEATRGQADDCAAAFRTYTAWCIYKCGSCALGVALPQKCEMSGGQPPPTNFATSRVPREEAIAQLRANHCLSTFAQPRAPDLYLTLK
jgi:hypothetical protein